MVSPGVSVPLTPDEGLRKRVALALLRLETWLETVHQPDGYAGPVVHWWRHSLRYTGPGIDWRYEGIVSGYTILAKTQADPRWQVRLHRAIEDVRRGQRPDGSYLASRFEQNPGTNGTPHEAAASLGLLHAARKGYHEDLVREVVGRNLEHIVATYWDSKCHTFNDHPSIVGYVPNKLATLAETLLEWGEWTGSEEYLDKAKAALGTVLQYQVHEGRFRGAIHQYAPAGGSGDGRFFPYYNARCVPALLKAAEIFGEDPYRRAAEAILGFLDQTMHENGSWPQIVYASNEVADGPRWLAGAADILRAYLLCGRPVSTVALVRLLQGQMQSGAFAAADGFFGFRSVPAWHDVIPVAGWNDKIFRFLLEWLDGRPFEDDEVGQIGNVDGAVRLGPKRLGQGRWIETPGKCELRAQDGSLLYRWVKSEPWATAETSFVGEG